MQSLGIRDLRKSVFAEELPSPRVIGNALETSKQNNSFAKNGIIPNLAGLMLGQLITHDISNKHIYSIKGFEHDVNNRPYPIFTAFVQATAVQQFVVVQKTIRNHWTKKILIPIVYQCLSHQRIHSIQVSASDV